MSRAGTRAMPRYLARCWSPSCHSSSLLPCELNPCIVFGTINLVSLSVLRLQLRACCVNVLHERALVHPRFRMMVGIRTVARIIVLRHLTVSVDFCRQRKQTRNSISLCGTKSKWCPNKKRPEETRKKRQQRGAKQPTREGTSPPILPNPDRICVPSSLLPSCRPPPSVSYC